MTVPVDELLPFLVQQFRSTSDELLQRLRYGDDGRGAEKMAALQKTLASEGKRTKLADRRCELSADVTLARIELARA
jgi:hypothetical protein